MSGWRKPSVGRLCVLTSVLLLLAADAGAMPSEVVPVSSRAAEEVFVFKPEKECCAIVPSDGARGGRAVKVFAQPKAWPVRLPVENLALSRGSVPRLRLRYRTEGCVPLKVGYYDGVRAETVKTLDIPPSETWSWFDLGEWGQTPKSFIFLVSDPKTAMWLDEIEVSVRRVFVSDAGFFRLEDGRLVNPDGREMRVFGVDHVRYVGVGSRGNRRRRYLEHNRTAYRTQNDWEVETLSRLADWGFNHFGIDAEPTLLRRGVPHSEMLSFLGNRPLEDILKPEFEARCEEIAARRCALLCEDPWVLGYYLDNEIHWNNATNRGIAFVRDLARRYFSVTTAAVRRHDPNHLILGCRFAGIDDWQPLDVWEIAGEHCDVLSVNVYPRIVMTDGTVSDWHGRLIDETWTEAWRRGRRPILLTEWSVQGLDAGLPCKHGPGQKFATQAERAQAAGLFARKALGFPFLLGYDFFMWVDDPPEGFSPEVPEDGNYGLVAEDGRVYPIVRTLAEIQKGDR